MKKNPVRNSPPNSQSTDQGNDNDQERHQGPQRLRTAEAQREGSAPNRTSTGELATRESSTRERPTAGPRPERAPRTSREIAAALAVLGEPRPESAPPRGSIPATPGAADNPFLAALDAPQRERFEALSPGKKAQLIDQAAVMGPQGYPFLIAELGTVQPPRPRRPLPPTTADLLLALPGGEPDWHIVAAEALTHDFGTKQDRKLWGQFDKLCGLAAWNPPLAKAMAKHHHYVMNHPINNKGSYFWTCTCDDFPDVKAVMSQLGVRMNH